MCTEAWFDPALNATYADEYVEELETNFDQLQWQLNNGEYFYLFIYLFIYLF